MQRHLAMLFAGVIVLIVSPALLAEEKALQAEPSELEDADYPDLVSADDEGEIIDEFAFLQEEDVVYTAAKHRQEIAESPSSGAGSCWADASSCT